MSTANNHQRRQGGADEEDDDEEEVQESFIHSGTGSGGHQDQPHHQEEEEDEDQFYLSQEQQQQLYQQLYMRQQSMNQQQNQNHDDQDDDEEDEASGPQTYQNTDDRQTQQQQNNQQLRQDDDEEDREPIKPQIAQTNHLKQLQQQLYSQQLQANLQNPYDDDEEDEDHHQNDQEDHEEEEEDNNQSEEGDEVNNLSFSHLDYKNQFQKQRQQLADPSDELDQDEDEDKELQEQIRQKQNQLQQYQQYQDQQDEEEDDQEQEQDDDNEVEEDEDDDDDDEEIGEMKAKFDKIMTNFMGQNGYNSKQQQQSSGQYSMNNQKQTQQQQQHQEEQDDEDGIMDFKNKNMLKNVKGLVNSKKNSQQQKEEVEEDEEDQHEYEAVVEGADDGSGDAINIQIKNKKLFPQTQKPPIPLKSALKNGNTSSQQTLNVQISDQVIVKTVPPSLNSQAQPRTRTPDRERIMREKQMNQQTNGFTQVNLKGTNQRSASQNYRPKSANINNKGYNSQINKAKNSGGSGQQSSYNSQPPKELQPHNIKLKNQQRPQTATVAARKKQQQLSNLQQQLDYENNSMINDENQMVDMNVIQQQQMILQKQLQAQNIGKMNRPQTAGGNNGGVGNVILPKFKRPQTASSAKSGSNLAQFKQNQKQKKTDPVSRYQNLQNEWKTNKFLKQSVNNKQGRKLDLDRFHKWSTLVHQQNVIMNEQKKTKHKILPPQKAPIDDRRDDLRFQLRAKISQKNYVDNQMKAFHYNQEIVQPVNHKGNSKKSLQQQQASLILQQQQQLQLVQQQLQQLQQYQASLALAGNNNGFADQAVFDESQLEMMKKQMNQLKKCVQ